MRVRVAALLAAVLVFASSELACSSGDAFSSAPPTEGADAAPDVHVGGDVGIGHHDASSSDDAAIQDGSRDSSSSDVAVDAVPDVSCASPADAGVVSNDCTAGGGTTGFCSQACGRQFFYNCIGDHPPMPDCIAVSSGSYCCSSNVCVPRASSSSTCDALDAGKHHYMTCGVTATYPTGCVMVASTSTRTDFCCP